MKTPYLAKPIIAVAVIGSLASFSAYASAPYASNPYNQTSVQDITPQTLISSDSSSDGPQPVDLKKIANQKAIKAANKAASKPPKQSGVYTEIGAGYGVTGLTTKGLQGAKYSDAHGVPLTGQAHIKAKGGLTEHIAVGYQFDPYVALELGWTRFADASYSQQFFSGAPLMGAGSTTVSNSLFNFLLKGMLPIGSTGISVIGKAGVAYVSSQFSSKYTWKDPSSDPHFKTSVTNHAIRPEVATGLAYHFTPNLSVDMTYNYIFGKGKPSISNVGYIPSLSYSGINLSYLW